MIVIRPMEETERALVASFVERIMREEYHCSAHGLPLTVFVALADHEIVGAMALSMSGGEPLPLEAIYKLDYGSFPEPFDRSRIVQLGRWSAKIGGVGDALVYAAIRHGIKLRCRWAIGEVKPKVARLYARMGLPIIPLAGNLISENIPKDVSSYYSEPPLPIPCTLSLISAEEKLWEKVGPRLLTKEIDFQYC